MSCDYQVAYKKDNPQVLEGCWKGQATCRGWLFYCRHLSQYLHISTMLPFFHVGVTLSEYPCHHRKLTPNPSIQPCMLKCNEISCSVSRIPIHRQPGRIKRLNSIFPRPNPWRIRIRMSCFFSCSCSDSVCCQFKFAFSLGSPEPAGPLGAPLALHNAQLVELCWS